MWRKHPLIRVGWGLGLGLLALTVFILAFSLWANFWQDGQQSPRLLDGQITSYSHHLQAGPVPGHFHFVGTTGEEHDFDLRDGVFELLQKSEPGSLIPATLNFSPHFYNLYSVQIGDQLAVLNQYQPGKLFQNWQLPAVLFLILVGLTGLIGLVYAGLSLADWFLPVQTVQGTLVARIERSELSLESFSVLVSPFVSRRSGQQVQFELNRAAFLATDGADFVSVSCTRLFRFVRQIQPIPDAALPPGVYPRLAPEHLRLRYNCGWRLWVFLYLDPVLGLLLLFLAILTLVSGSAFSPDPQQLDSARYSMLVTLGVLFFSAAVFLLLRFRRKLQDIKSPRQLAVGPVLSKWRVTQTSQDNRRLIVMADGGIGAGQEAVRRFDVSPALYDQLQVGDIVEIEHTRRLRFICRLEVKGHQELTVAG